MGLFNLICSSMFLKVCTSLKTAVLPNAFMADVEGWDKLINDRNLQERVVVLYCVI